MERWKQKVLGRKRKKNKEEFWLPYLLFSMSPSHQTVLEIGSERVALPFSSPLLSRRQFWKCLCLAVCTMKRNDVQKKKNTRVSRKNSQNCGEENYKKKKQKTQLKTMRCG